MDRDVVIFHVDLLLNIEVSEMPAAGKDEKAAANVMKSPTVVRMHSVQSHTIVPKRGGLSGDKVNTHSGPSVSLQTYYSVCL